MAQKNSNPDVKKVVDSLLKDYDQRNPDVKKVVDSLLKDYDQANKALADAKSKVEAAMVARSVIVKKLAETAGMTIKRPNGTVLKVMSRTPKNEKGEPTGETTWFFRGEAPVDAFEAGV